MNSVSSEMYRSSYSQERRPCFLAFVFETAMEYVTEKKCIT